MLGELPVFEAIACIAAVEPPSIRIELHAFVTIAEVRRPAAVARPFNGHRDLARGLLLEACGHMLLHLRLFLPWDEDLGNLFIYEPLPYGRPSFFAEPVLPYFPHPFQGDYGLISIYGQSRRGFCR